MIYNYPADEYITRFVLMNPNLSRKIAILFSADGKEQTQTYKNKYRDLKTRKYKRINMNLTE